MKPIHRDLMMKPIHRGHISRGIFSHSALSRLIGVHIPQLVVMQLLPFKIIFPLGAVLAYVFVRASYGLERLSRHVAESMDMYIEVKG